MDAPDVYAPPVAEVAQPGVAAQISPAGELVGEYMVKRLDRAGRGEMWTLLVYPDRLDFTAPDGVSFPISASTFGERLVAAPTGQIVILTLRLEKMMFELSEFNADAFRRDLGAHLQRWGDEFARFETKHAIWIGLGLGALWFFIGGLIVGVLAAANLIAGIGRLLGAGRWLFLLAAARALALIVAVALDILVFGVSWWLAIAALFFMLGVTMSVRRFRFFGLAR